MADTWIKMRTDVATDPAVIFIAFTMKIDEDTVVGKLHRIWSWADGQTSDGIIPNVSGQWIDRHLSCPGFAAAMVKAGWLEVSDTGVRFPRFDKHNGKSAKKRAENTERARLSRSCHTICVTDALADKTRQDKSREDLLDSSNDPQALLASLPDKRQMLTMLRVVNPAFDLICECEALTPAILDREYRSSKRGKGVKDATGVFVASVCKIGGITLPKRGAASVGRALALAMPTEDQEKAKAIQAMARNRRGATA